LPPLVVPEGGELAGASARNQPADAAGDQPVDDRGQRVGVDGAAVLGERRDERGQYAVERLRHG